MRHTNRDRLLRLVQRNPRLSIRDYAATLGISHQRVHKLLTALGYTEHREWVRDAN